MRITPRLAAAAAVPAVLFALAACSSGDKTSDTPSATDGAPVATSGETTQAPTTGDVVTVSIPLDNWEETHTAEVKPGDTLKVVVTMPENFVDEEYTGDCIEGKCPAFLGKGNITVDGTTEVAQYPVTGTGKGHLTLIFDTRHDADQPNQPYDAAGIDIEVTSAE